MITTLDKVNKSEFLVYDVERERYVKICEGTGDNLLSEDIEEGYVDYIYYSEYDNISDYAEDNESDGGMVLLKQLYADMRIEDIIKQMQEFGELSKEYEVLK